MSYWDIAQMSVDIDLTTRVAACAAHEGEADPRTWAGNNMLLLGGSEGWEVAWAAAIADGVDQPGRDGSVITDPMILTGVRSVMGRFP